MAILLGIETSGASCSVSIFQNQQVAALVETEIPMLHAEKLTQLIDFAAKTANLKLDNLQGVVVSAGPGSYTGLRIGTSVAKGICFGLSIPLLSVSTLATWIESIRTNFSAAQNYLSILQARNGEYWIRGETQMGEIWQEDCLVSDNKLEILLNQTQNLAIGGIVRPDFKMNFMLKMPFIPIQTSAKFLNRLAQQKFDLQLFENLISFEPSYLKEVYITRPKK